MSYASVDDLKSRIGELFIGLYTDSDGEELTELAENDLKSAQGEIDGMISNRYQTPVENETILPMLQNWTLTLTEELSWGRSGKDKLPENLKLRVDRVHELLEKIANGTMSLVGAIEIEEGTISDSFLIETEAPVFTRDSMKGF